MAKAPLKTKTNTKKRNWLAISVIVLSSIIMFLLGGFAGWYYLKIYTATDPTALSIVIYRYPSNHPIVEKTTESPLYASTYYEFTQPIITNLLNSKRIIQINLGLATTYDASVMTAVEQHGLAIRSAALQVLSATEEADLKSESNKRKILEKIRDAANAVLLTKNRFPGIESAHFGSISVQ